MNKEVSDEAKNDNYGHNVSKVIAGKRGISAFGDNPHTKMLIATSAACDVRMDGAKMVVMSNSGVAIKVLLLLCQFYLTHKKLELMRRH